MKTLQALPYRSHKELATLRGIERPLKGRGETRLAGFVVFEAAVSTADGGDCFTSLRSVQAGKRRLAYRLKTIRYTR